MLRAGYRVLRSGFCVPARADAAAVAEAGAAADAGVGARQHAARVTPTGSAVPAPGTLHTEPLVARRVPADTAPSSPPSTIPPCGPD